MSTAVVLAVVAALMLIGMGIVISQLLRLRDYLDAAPPYIAPDQAPEARPGDDVD